MGYRWRKVLKNFEIATRSRMVCQSCCGKLGQIKVGNKPRYQCRDCRRSYTVEECRDLVELVPVGCLYITDGVEI